MSWGLIRLCESMEFGVSDREIGDLMRGGKIKKGKRTRDRAVAYDLQTRQGGEITKLSGYRRGDRRRRQLPIHHTQ